jgi:hypothetical protein
LMSVEEGRDISPVAISALSVIVYDSCCRSPFLLSFRLLIQFCTIPCSAKFTSWIIYVLDIFPVSFVFGMARRKLSK